MFNTIDANAYQVGAAARVLWNTHAAAAPAAAGKHRAAARLTRPWIGLL